MENEEQHIRTETVNPSEGIPFPDEDWFNEPELDKTLELFEYDVGGEKKKVAFWIESMNHNEARKILAEYQEVDNLTGITTTDNERYNDRMIRESVSYGDPPKYLNQKQIEEMKRNKKSGIYTGLVYRIANRSDVLTPETIQKEKK
jgi:hypothetical protein